MLAYTIGIRPAKHDAKGPQVRFIIIMLSPTAYFIAINRAERDGFTHLATALLACYLRDYPNGPRPTWRITL